MVIVAAAGNNNDNADNYYPANLWNVITVAASDVNGAKASFSDWGGKIDVTAPGVDILSLRAAGTSLGTSVDDNYTRLDGTSMATPHVSGLAALILSAHPEYSNEDVRQAIRASADNLGQQGFDPDFGYGRIDASAAVALSGALEAKITSPTDGTTVQSPIAITGVARGAGFVSYKLEYASGPQPDVWTTFQTGTTPVSGTLGTFDATAVPDGAYVIRLTAYNVAGQAFVDRIQVTAAAVAISTPVPPAFPTSATTFKPGVSIPISGTTTAVGFRNFQIVWARGVNANSGWQSTGISLVSGGTAQIANAVLANWDTSSISQADYYTIQLTVTAANFTSVATSMVYLQPDLLSANWPQDIEPGPYLIDSGPVPAQNGDGSTRLLLNPYIGPGFWTLPLDGPPQLSEPGTYCMFCQPAVAALDGGTTEEAVQPGGLGIEILGQDGNVSLVWSAQNTSIVADPVVAHLHGGSEWDIMAFSQDPHNTQVGYVFAWRPDGTSVNSNFPIQVSGLSPSIEVAPVRTVVGDIDGDGENEIVVVEMLTSSLTESTFTLGLFGNDGTPRTWNVGTLKGEPTAIAAADLDNSGKLEIVVVAVSPSDGKFTVHVFQPDGSERAGWPLTRGRVYYPSIAIGDLNRNGSKQIVIASMGLLYVFNADGTPFSEAWPLQAPGESQFGPAVIGDVDGDGFPEIVTVRNDWDVSSVQPFSNQKLIAIRRDGTISRSWQLADMQGKSVAFSAVPVIGDFNHDGLADIAVSYQVDPGCTFCVTTVPLPGVVTILTTGAPFNASLNDWPMIYQNPQNNPVIPSSGKSSDTGSGGAGSPCTFTVDSSGHFFGAAGGTALISVTTPAGCQWTASSASDWVTITSGSSGSGNGSVIVAAAANSGSSQRAGQVLVAGTQLAVAQEAASVTGMNPSGSLAQIAFGGGWDTSIVLMNLQSANPAPAELDFFANDGSVSAVPLTSPQQSFSGTMLSPVFGQQISASGQLILDASDSSAALAGTAWAQVQASGPIGGFSIFKNHSGQEAVVPLETRNAPSYLMAFDNTGQIATGLAIANVATDRYSGNIRVIIRDDTGADIGTGFISLTPQGHNSFMLTDTTYGFPATAGKRGTVEFDMPTPMWQISVLGLRANGAAITTLPVFANTGAGGGTMAHIASGGGWQTLITLVNTGTSPAQSELQFLDEQGKPMALPLGFPQTGATANESSVSQALAAGGSLLIETQGTAGQTAQVGSAQLTTTGAVSGFAIFRNSGQEAVVPLASGNPTSQFLVFDNTNGLATGIALSNGSGSPAAIPVALRDDAGSLLARATINLPANGHTSKMLTDLFPAASKIRGSVEFDTPAGGQISALGIRATPAGAYTTIPVMTQ